LHILLSNLSKSEPCLPVPPHISTITLLLHMIILLDVLNQKHAQH
jgi:hypothetical protein